MVKNSPPNAGDARDLGLIPGLGRFPGVEMTTHSSILAWKILWTKESGGLQSMGSHRVRHNGPQHSTALAACGHIGQKNRTEKIPTVSTDIDSQLYQR